MDLTNLNLSEDQLKDVTEYTTGEVTKAKESFKDFLGKDEVEKITQSASDKVRTEYSKKMKDLQDELVKYKPKDLSPEQIDLNNRIKALENKEKELQSKEKLINVSDKLKQEGLPSQLSKYLTGVEDIETEVNSLKELFNNLALNNSFVPSNHKAKTDAINFEDFKKMNYDNKLNLMQTNKELYDKYSLMTKKEKGWV